MFYQLHTAHHMHLLQYHPKVPIDAKIDPSSNKVWLMTPFNWWKATHCALGQILRLLKLFWEVDLALEAPQ
ncbi:unnamed protein product [Blepharisma stoltei]|uniref:Uncharacterized protein n=1 Tax=Blepharisma stoltei TaxID=1481888 RepID=A0AAU9J134_9CILI|nr:unnamed protein product [Blepharisma stoltei]